MFLFEVLELTFKVSLSIVQHGQVLFLFVFFCSWLGFLDPTRQVRRTFFFSDFILVQAEDLLANFLLCRSWSEAGHLLLEPFVVHER